MTEQEMIIAISLDQGWTPYSVEADWSMWFAPGEKHKQLERTHRLPKWPTDLNAAITLCDALAEEGWGCRIERGSQWQVWFIAVGFAPNVLPTAMNPHPATAICIAYCKVKGIWPESTPAALQPCTSEPGSGRYD